MEWATYCWTNACLAWSEQGWRPWALYRPRVYFLSNIIISSSTRARPFAAAAARRRDERRETRRETRDETRRETRDESEGEKREPRAAQKAARSAEAPAGEAASLVTLQSRRAPVPRVILCFVALYVYLVLVTSCDPDSSLASSGGSGSAFAFECRRGNSQTPRHRCHV